MPEESINLDISAIVAVKQKELNCSESDKILQCLEKALQSIAKRIEYCQYHYAEFEKHTSPELLKLERAFDLRQDGFSIRTKYEADSIAFLQNLHALIDSFPYALNIIFKVESDFESAKICWKDDFIKKYNKYPFYEDLDKFSEDEVFVKLKSFVNRSKHKHLVRISNNYKDLEFEDFTYRRDEKGICQKDQNVRKFMASCHDYLIPKFFSLCNSIKNCKESEVYKNEIKR